MSKSRWSFSRPRAFSNATIPKCDCSKGSNSRVSVLHGEVPTEILAKENGITFAYDLRKGQKTGSFLDQRENHLGSATLCFRRSSRLLQLSGRIRANGRGACEHVEAIDMAPQPSKRPAEIRSSIPSRTSLFAKEIRSTSSRNTTKSGRQFQMVILDPPAFAKNRDSVPAAQRGYKEINLRALKLLKPGGFLVTCSCSYHITEALFLQILAEAANRCAEECSCGANGALRPRTTRFCSRCRRHTILSA